MLKKNDRWITEWIVFALLAISLGIVSFFHEPWLNEAQAWQIARNADLSEILFQIPHYEGHPALWHLMLLIPAKCNMPYELSIKVISSAAVLIIGWLILFRSPFPKLMRILLPFHYFIFYQNGVVSRPYGYMTLALLLMAVFYREKDEKPWRFAAAMLLLCVLSGYGIVIAGGVAIVWVIQICSEHGWKILSAFLWKDKRIPPLVMLLAAAVLIALQILPDPNAFAFTLPKNNSVFICLLYHLFAILPDSTLTNILGCEEMAAYASFDTGALIVGIIAGILFLLAMILFSSRKNRWYLIVPYFLFGVFSTFVYLTAHHIGVVLSLILFWLWIAFEDPDKGELFRKLSGKIKLQEKERVLLKRIGIVFGMMLFIIPVFWTMIASVYEIKYDYCSSKKMAAFIREHGLEEATFLARWSDEEEPINVNALYAKVNPVAIMPYFSHNFCLNLNEGRENMAYIRHVVATPKESVDTLERIREKGLPEGLIGSVDLKLIYGEDVDPLSYVPVYEITPFYVTVWKYMRVNVSNVHKNYIYMRKDVLEKYGLQEIDW